MLKGSLYKTLSVLFMLIMFTAVLLVLFLYQILYSDNLATSRDTYVLVGWIVVGVLFFVAAAGTVTILTITREMRKLKEAAIGFANGDLSQKIELSSKNEVGQLAIVFNQMSDRLRNSYQR